MKRTSALGRGSNDVEARLWAKLREFEGYEFHRKAPFKSFVLDFVEHEALLVIELDDGEPGQASPRNVARDHMLAEAGYTVLRFWRSEAARDLNGVVASIKRVLEDRPSSVRLRCATPHTFPYKGGRRN